MLIKAGRVTVRKFCTPPGRWNVPRVTQNMMKPLIAKHRSTPRCPQWRMSPMLKMRVCAAASGNTRERRDSACASTTKAAAMNLRTWRPPRRRRVPCGGDLTPEHDSVGRGRVASSTRVMRIACEHGLPSATRRETRRNSVPSAAWPDAGSGSKPIARAPAVATTGHGCWDRKDAGSAGGRADANMHALETRMERSMAGCRRVFPGQAPSRDAFSIR